MNSFGLLSISNSPFLRFLFNYLKEINFLPKCIIFAGKNLSEEDLKRFFYRIGEIFDPKEYKYQY